MARRLLSRLRALRRLAADRGGTVMVEFAIAFPVMLALYIGGYTLSDAIACNRKVTMTARALSDLATRYPNLSESDATTILSASAQVIYPYDATKVSVVLSEVQVTSSTQAIVKWSRAQNGTVLTQDSTITIPTGMASVGTYLIVGTAKYTYVPTAKLATFFNNQMVLTDTIMMLPRVSDQVPIS